MEKPNEAELLELNAEQRKVLDDLQYVGNMLMNITGWLEFDWYWTEEGNVVVYNTQTDSGSIPDDMDEVARLVARLSNWDVFEISDADEYNQWNENSQWHDGDKFYIGLKPKTEFKGE